MTGRNPFSPTDEQRCTVRTMAGFGVPQEAIADHLRFATDADDVNDDNTPPLLEGDRE